MANPVKGEASVTLASGETLTLRYDFEALCAVEDAADKPISEVLASMAKGAPRLGVARSLVHGGLRAHHPEIDLAAAGELLLSDGQLVSEAMHKALASAFPQAAPATGGRKGSRPPRSKGRAGTGTGS